MFQIVLILFFALLQLASCDDFYSKFQQHDYKVEFTRLEVVQYNKDIFNKLEVVTFKYNRTMAVANGTFQLKVRLDSTKLNIIIQGHKFLSNEYRIFPMHFQLNFCHLYQQNIAGVFDILNRCGNVKRCNFKKDVVYHICNMYPDQERLPPFIPNGDYKMEFTVVYENLTIIVANAYAKVFRPIKY